MSRRSSKPVPVLMYHSVGIPDKRWHWNYLTCPYDLFEDQLKMLRKKGFVSITLDQLHGYIFNSEPVPEKSIVFTFDDGYLDNWVFAYPLMKKYGFHGTIYVNPEFVDEKGGKRLRYDEVTDPGSLHTTGFLSWDEMYEMEKEGVMFIESHAMTHTWYPKSEKIIDYRHPGDKYIWMTWNNSPGLKYRLQIDDETLIRYGEPVYEHEKSLSGRRFFPDRGLSDHLCEYVRQKGGTGFFSTGSWKEMLDEEVNLYKSKNSLDERYETEDEYLQRISNELISARTIIENKLDKKVLFHCWPGGSATKKGMEISDSIGFRLTNTANDIKEIRYRIKNNDELKINRINRFAPVIYWDNRFFTKYSDGRLLILQTEAFTGKGISSIGSKIILRLVKIILKIKYRQIPQ